MTDSMSPTFIVVDEQGRYGAELEGRIRALGLILPASTLQTPPDEARVIWENAAGETIADIWAYSHPLVRTTTWQLPNEDDPAAGTSTGINLQRNNLADSRGAINAFVPESDGGGFLSATILRSHPTVADRGVSSFLRRQDLGGVGVDWGSTAVTGNAAPTRSKVVNHSLKVVPAIVLAIVSADSPGFYVNAKPVDDDELELVVSSRTGNNFSTTHTVYWLAIA